MGTPLPPFFFRPGDTWTLRGKLRNKRAGFFPLYRRYLILYLSTIHMTHKLIYMVDTGISEVKDMTTTITQAQVDAHNDRVIARTVAHLIWARTSRMDTSTRHATWSRWYPMALKFNKKWRKLAQDFKKNGRPFHYQYLIRKKDTDTDGGKN